MADVLAVQVDGVPGGYELVRIGFPVHGEQYVSAADREVVETYSVGVWGNGPRLIVRPVFVWPDWIWPGCWLVQNPNGTWMFTAPDDEPRYDRNCDGWRHSGFALRHTGGILDFTPPPCDDWRKSKRQKPYPACNFASGPLGYGAMTSDVNVTIPYEAGIVGCNATQAVVTQPLQGVYVGREMEK